MLTINSEVLEEGLVLVAPAGPIDHRTYESLEKTLARLSDDGVTRMILDLSGVTYICSAGMGTLFWWMTEAETEDDGAFILCNLSKMVREVFVAVGLMELFTIADSRENALKAAARKRSPK